MLTFGICSLLHKGVQVKMKRRNICLNICQLFVNRLLDMLDGLFYILFDLLELTSLRLLR